MQLIRYKTQLARLVTQYFGTQSNDNLEIEVALAESGKGSKMKNFLRNFWLNTHGQDLVEYALAAGMVAVGAVAAMPQLSTTVSDVFLKIAGIVSNNVQ
jgi:pilus assembly protein Flp/PilA